MEAGRAVSTDKQAFADDLFALADAIEAATVPAAERACGARCSHGGVCTKTTSHDGDHATLKSQRDPARGAYCTWPTEAVSQ